MSSCSCVRLYRNSPFLLFTPFSTFPPDLASVLQASLILCYPVSCPSGSRLSSATRRKEQSSCFASPSGSSDWNEQESRKEQRVNECYAPCQPACALGPMAASQVRASPSPWILVGPTSCPLNAPPSTSPLTLTHGCRASCARSRDRGRRHCCPLVRSAGPGGDRGVLSLNQRRRRRLVRASLARSGRRAELHKEVQHANARTHQVGYTRDEFQGATRRSLAAINETALLTLVNEQVGLSPA